MREQVIQVVEQYIDAVRHNDASAGARYRSVAAPASPVLRREFHPARVNTAPWRVSRFRNKVGAMNPSREGVR